MPGLLGIKSAQNEGQWKASHKHIDIHITHGKKISHQQQQKSGLLTIAKEIGKQTAKHKAELAGSSQYRAIPQ